jgi:hypothetical protein
VEPRRIDLDALLNAHAFMRVERPPLLWGVDVDDEPFIRMLGEMIVVGLLHHDVLAELTLNVSNVTVGDDGPDGVAAGDYVAITIEAPGDLGGGSFLDPGVDGTVLESRPRRRRPCRIGIVRLPAPTRCRRRLDHGLHPSIGRVACSAWP